MGAQEQAFTGQFEASGLDLTSQKGLFDAVQRARLGDARAGPSSVVGKHMNTA